MRNCFLIVFQHAPPGMRAENPEVVRSVTGRGKDRQLKRDNRERWRRVLGMKHPGLDFGFFNTMVAEC